MVECIWCGREMPKYPATIPHIYRDGKYICHRCVRHLAAIVRDQVLRHPNRVVVETERFDALIYAVRAEIPDEVVVIVKSQDGGGDEVYGGPDGYTIEPLAVERTAVGVVGEVEVEFEMEGAL